MPQALVNAQIPAQKGNPAWVKGFTPPGAKPWQPGVSANPGGKGGRFLEAQRICREASPEAATTLVSLMCDDDPKIRGWASDKVLVWAWGKPQEYDPSKEAAPPMFDPSKLSPEQLAQAKAVLLMLMATAQSAPDVGTSDGTETVVENKDEQS